MPVVFDYTTTTAFEKGELKEKKEDTFGMFAERLNTEAIARITKQPLETIEAWKKNGRKKTKTKSPLKSGLLVLLARQRCLLSSVG